MCNIDWITDLQLYNIVKTENEKRRSVMKVQAFCEETGLRPF